MRRCLSILLILVFGLMPLPALAGGGEDPGLPPCCRGDGAHHCALSIRRAARRAEMEAETTASLRAPLTCPIYPRAGTAFSTPPLALTAESAQAAERTRARFAPIAESIPSSRPSRTHAGRGPPEQNPS
jgi:hypothetical protein